MADNRTRILITATDQTRAAFDSVRRNLGDLGTAARSLRGLLAGLGLTVSGGAIAALIKSSLDAADALNKLSQSTGISVQTLSTLIKVADLSGVSSEELAVGLRKLASDMAAAAAGSEEAAASFEQLGVAVESEPGVLRPVDEVLLDIADRFKSLPDGAKKTALAMALFGRSGATLIPLLNAGREGIAELTKELEALGIQVGGETAAGAERFNDQIAKIRIATEGAANRLTEALLPALNRLADTFVESAKQGGALRGVLDGLGFTLKALALGAAGVGQAFAAVGESIGALFAAAFAENARGAQAILAELSASLKARWNELAQLKAELFDGAGKGAGEPTKPTPAGGAPDKPKPKDSLVSARLALAKAEADAELRVMREGLERSTRVLDQALKDRLISVREYHEEKAGLDIQGINAELAALGRMLGEQRRLTGEGREEDRIKAQAEVVKLESEILVLEARRGEVAGATAAKIREADREVADSLAKVREELAALTGESSQGMLRAAIERGYVDLKARLAGDVEGLALVDRLIDLKSWDASLNALEARWRQALERMRNAEQSANIQEQQGLITTWEAQRQIGAAHAEASAELEKLLPLMEQAATAIGPEAVARVQAWKNELASVRTVIDPTVQALRTTMETSFAAAFTAFITGAQTAKQAFAGFVRSVIAGLAQIAAQQMARALFGSLFGGLLGGFSGGGSVPAIGKASGGIIRGPGTGTSDSIPAWLSDGEYVLRAAAVRRIGVGFLDFLNSGPDLPRRGLAFAGGGMVDLDRAEGSSRAPTPSPAAGVRIVNVIDPRLAGDYLSSSAGERTILNVLSRNAGAVRQLLR